MKKRRKDEISVERKKRETERNKGESKRNKK